MQAAKDSFFMALQARLAALNPARTVMVDGVAVPGILVRENMEPRFTAATPGVFYLDWGDIQIVESTPSMVEVGCEIRYVSAGSSETGVDRGRLLGQMDQELMSICRPSYTRMQDYTQVPSVDLGMGICWSLPQVADVTNENSDLRGGRSAGAWFRERRAQLKVYFFELEAVG